LRNEITDSFYRIHFLTLALATHTTVVTDTV
jgi:hypothetical protein